jgi:uncharacterized membrane protein YdbT with pleckstrin-like domain
MDWSRHHHLDPRVKLIWFLPGLGVILFLWVAAVVLLFFLQPNAPVLGLSGPVFSAGLLFFLLIFVAGPVYAYHHLEYVSFTYELGPREFIIRQGVFTRETAVIPYERIQNINTRRTVLERFLGLATLVIDTAGTNPEAAEGLLPGISKKDVLIREIMDRVEKEKARGDSARAGGEGGELASERQLLADILKEIVQLKHGIHALGDMRKSPRTAADEAAGAPKAPGLRLPPSVPGRAKDSKP